MSDENNVGFLQVEKRGRWTEARSELDQAPGSDSYQPEIWQVEKDVIYAAIPAVEAGLEYARECLTTHDSSLGRTTHKNKTWAETMEKDIRNMERTLATLRACGPNNKLSSGANGTKA